MLERLGDVAPRKVRTPAYVASVLDSAATEIEHSLAFWAGYQTRMLGDQSSNHFGDPAGAAGGVLSIIYSHCGVALGDDEALVVTVVADDAPLWDVQLYNRPWYEALDAAGRTNSTNHRMATIDDDGSVHVVISGRDTGAPNWLDTEGRDEVLASIRWWRPDRPPTVRSEVVPVTDVPGAGRVSGEARAEERRRRAAHTAWRYRT